jgi:hypothetical protein
MEVRMDKNDEGTGARDCEQDINESHSQSYH